MSSDAAIDIRSVPDDRKWTGLPGPCIVYALLADEVGPNDILYIGHTNNVGRRAREHARAKRSFHTMLILSNGVTRRDAMSIEHHLIGKYRPKLNSAREYQWLTEQLHGSRDWYEAG